MRKLSVPESGLSAVLAELRRPARDLLLHREQAREVIHLVRSRGDASLFELSRKFDGVQLETVRVQPERIRRAEQALVETEKRALLEAARNIRRFHRWTMQPEDLAVGIRHGVRCGRIVRPLDSVGLYVPGGRAPLVSTLLMLAIPAQLAGVERIAVATPAEISPTILAVCGLLGLDEVYQLGGMQAIAALAYGTESIEPVVKIAGPGNIWVTAAKAEVGADPEAAGIDLLAGPSELMVIADDSANIRALAADLIAQAEHDELARVALISPHADLLTDVEQEVTRQVALQPRRNIADESLRASWLIEVGDLVQALQIANRWAPEHLSLQTRSPQELLGGIRNAGSIFLGHFSPETVGDYCSGPNHVLPTGGAARCSGGVTVSTFQKQISVQSLSRPGLERLQSTAVTLARLEGLEGHARAVEIRFEDPS